ncbi:hypothetical protein E2C01_101832 [Portunus trituberculatus]|uniref:Uncharacterized protein n=1 Tax=Portunus trituberculatus TaxID=210409 RepID=A0A5B7K6M6_PORTR|nr:hypothetical protein [Portunus trituberculatus]
MQLQTSAFVHCDTFPLPPHLLHLSRVSSITPPKVHCHSDFFVLSAVSAAALCRERRFCCLGSLLARATFCFTAKWSVGEANLAQNV